MSVSAPTSTCGGCGAQMDPARATYDKNGVLLCPACAAKNTIAEGDARAVSSTVGSAVGILVGGILSTTCFNPFWLVSIITLLSGFGWLGMVARNPAHRAKMGSKFVPCTIAVCFGLLCAALPLLGLALAMLGLAVGRR